MSRCSKAIPCGCIVGTHIWNAVPAENEHIYPHDPETNARTDAWIARMRADRKAWKEACKERGITHWSEPKNETIGVRNE